MAAVAGALEDGSDVVVEVGGVRAAAECDTAALTDVFNDIYVLFPASVTGDVLVSTCNRVEVVACCATAGHDGEAIADRLFDDTGLTDPPAPPPPAGW